MKITVKAEKIANVLLTLFGLMIIFFFIVSWTGLMSPSSQEIMLAIFILAGIQALIFEATLFIQHGIKLWQVYVFAILAFGMMLVSDLTPTFFPLQTPLMFITVFMIYIRLCRCHNKRRRSAGQSSQEHHVYSDTTSR